MSVLAMAWVWKQRGLTQGQKLVLMAIADHADDDGVCYPGIATLADKCECSERKIIYTIGELVKMGLLSKTRRTFKGAGSGRGSTSNCYSLAVNNQSANIAHRSTTNVKKRDDQCEKTCATYKEEPSEEPSDSPLNPPTPKFPYLPEWVPSDAWHAYLQSRQAQRASVAAWQIPLLLKQLDRLRQAGNDPGEVVEQSARSGYKDFFPVKAHATHQRNRPETAREHHARISEYINRQAAEAAAEIMGQAAVGQVDGDLRDGLDAPFWGGSRH